MCVCVCVWVGVGVCVCERERERESVCVCVVWFLGCIMRVSNQNGISLRRYIVEIHHSGSKLSIMSWKQIHF